MKRLRIVLFDAFLVKKSFSFISKEGRWSATCGKAFLIIRITEFAMLLIILSNSVQSHCGLFFAQKFSKDKMFPNLSNKWLTGQIFLSIHSLKNKGLFLKRMTLWFQMGVSCREKSCLCSSFQYNRTCEWKEDNLTGNFWIAKSHRKRKSIPPHFLNNPWGTRCQTLWLFVRNDLNHLIFRVQFKQSKSYARHIHHWTYTVAWMYDVTDALAIL